MKIQYKTLFMITFILLIVTSSTLAYDAYIAEPYPPEAYVSVMQGNICVKTQEPLWKWIDRQRFFVQAYGQVSERMC